MLPSHNLWDLEGQRGRGFLNLEGKSHKQEELLRSAIKPHKQRSLTQFFVLDLFLFTLLIFFINLQNNDN